MANIINEIKVLLVEGKDEENFFAALLKHLTINDVQVSEVGGKDKFPNGLAAFLLTYGSQVRAYGIIRDADRSREDAFKSVVNLLKKKGEPYPEKTGEYAENKIRKVGVFIMPGNQDEGMLEDLCLQTVADHPVMACTEQYFSCLSATLDSILLGQHKKQGSHYYPKNPSKAKAQAFLAGNHETFNSVGVAAHNGCWNFDHPVLTELKKFIQAL